MNGRKYDTLSRLDMDEKLKGLEGIDGDLPSWVSEELDSEEVFFTAESVFSSVKKNIYVRQH